MKWIQNRHETQIWPNSRAIIWHNSASRNVCFALAKKRLVRKTLFSRARFPVRRDECICIYDCICICTCTGTYTYTIIYLYHIHNIHYVYILCACWSHLGTVRCPKFGWSTLEKMTSCSVVPRNRRRCWWGRRRNGWSRQETRHGEFGWPYQRKRWVYQK